MGPPLPSPGERLLRELVRERCVARGGSERAHESWVGATAERVDVGLVARRRLDPQLHLHEHHTHTTPAEVPHAVREPSSRSRTLAEVREPEVPGRDRWRTDGRLRAFEVRRRVLWLTERRAA